MSTITPTRILPAKPLSFGHEGHLDFNFWRIQVLHPLILLGVLGFSLTLHQYGSTSFHRIMPWLLVTCWGLQILEVTRTVWKNRHGYSSFLNSKVMIEETPEFQQRFSTGIDRSSPIRGGLMGEQMLLAACLIIAVASRPDPQLPSKTALFLLAVGSGILSLIQIALMTYRGPRMEVLLVTEKGLLRLNREPGWFDKLPNEFLPWECITRAVASEDKGWWNQILIVELNRGVSDRTIRFTKLGKEDWERMLKAIGERTEVVREKRNG